ncbi:MAG: DUF348 domain-containing protein [Streptosporangiales bacterium]|nr:DUF348 domain-containing protein [Streptosporangiales bacterium]
MTGGGVAYAAMDNSVQLTVDGKTQTVHTFSDDVSSVLEKADVDTGKRDLVAPKLSSSIGDGDRIVVKHARKVTISVDGKEQKRWVTALSVSEALKQFGLRDKNMRVSADRSTRIPLSGMEIEVSLPKRVSVTADDETEKLLSFGTTVGDAVADAGVSTDSNDVVKPKQSKKLEEGEKIRVYRVSIKKTKKTVAIAPPVKKEKTDDLERGETKVEDPGKAGKKVVYYKTRIVDGKKGEPKKIREKVLKKPETKTVLVGTAAPSSGMDGTFWTLGGWDWKYLAECESGMNPDASNGTHFGLYQFSQSTWESVGGTGDPRDASPEEQTRRAYKLIESAGPSQWTCPTRRV